MWISTCYRHLRHCPASSLASLRRASPWARRCCSTDAAGAEPSLHSLGLASWWPPGRLQLLMEHFHVGLDMSWCSAIILTTGLLRLVSFPLAVYSQRKIVVLSNVMPQVQVLQDKMTEARSRGDIYDSARYAAEIDNLMKKNQINPLSPFLPMVLNAPLFLSMFMGLRAMASLPVPSMGVGGGCGWFTDLTAPDPLFILPVLTSASLFLQIKFSVEANGSPPGLAVLFKAFPVLLLAISVKFPAAVTLYWCTTNIISLAQGFAMRNDRVKKRLGIPQAVKWTQHKVPPRTSKSFRQSLSESMDNFRVAADFADRRAAQANRKPRPPS